MKLLLVGLLASSILGPLVYAASRHGRPPFTGTVTRNHKDDYYKVTWGIDQMEVRKIASGSMLQFRYRVLDPERAELLNDKRAEPYLLDATTGGKFAVPQAERIGKLRTTTTPKAGRVYWVMFEDPQHRVQHGRRVSVVIGRFRVDGLTVE